jgi:hypothetical protein
MRAPALCHLCGRLAPLGGVLDDGGRPCHYLCLGLARQRIAYDAQITAKRVAKRLHTPQTSHPAPLLPAGA